MARLFVCREVVSQIDASIDLVEQNITLINEQSMKAQYIYIYSVFESVLTETLRYYLASFPEKIEKNIMISKEQLLSSPLTGVVTLDVINTYIRGFSSDSLRKYIEFYLKTLELAVDFDGRDIQRIVSVRNTIVHDNFKTSSILCYVAPKNSEELKASVLRSDCLCLKNLLSEISVAVNEKYQKYTLEKVCRTVWEEIFFTPLLKFDDIWRIDKGIIHIREFDKEKYTCLGTGEKTLFAVFLQQYSTSLNDKLFGFKDMAAICSLDNSSREKLINIIQIFIAHPYLFNGANLN